VVGVNRTDRLYALVEELRAVAPRPRSARWLADRFEVSARTIERDIGALQQSGVPVWAEAGRSGGYCLDKDRTLPPVNFTPGEAMALAVALRRVAGTPFGQDGAAALRKVLAAMRKDVAVELLRTRQIVRANLEPRDAVESRHVSLLVLVPGGFP
jgi:predicted DNA-binding transcriptional regulator YafY